MSSSLPNVPRVMSLEGRANMIADVAGRADFSRPHDRREAVKREALAHLQIIAARAANGDGVVGD